MRTLGKTGLTVGDIGYGAMHLSIDRDRRPVEKDSITLLQRGVDELGIDLIDTADAYCADHTDVGHNERLIAEALRGERRHRVFVATKGGSVRPDGRWSRDGRPEHLRSACEASLRALETDRIDLYQLHAIDPAVPLEESVGALADLQREGKIRFIGMSNVDADELARATREAEIVSVQNRFSVIARDPDEDAVIELCEANGLAYLPWNPIGGRGIAPKLGETSAALDEIAAAHATSPHVVALAWLLQRSPVIIPIPGTRRFEHMSANMQAAQLELTSEDLERLG